MRYIFLICICLSLTACFENGKDKKFINEKITQFLDMNKIAKGTPKIALTVPLSKMQEYQGELKQLEVDSSCKSLKNQTINHMDTIMSTYLSFISEESNVLSILLSEIAEEDLVGFVKLESCGEYNKKLSQQEKKRKEQIAKNKNFNDKKWWKRATFQKVAAEIKNGADVNTDDNEDKFHPIEMALRYSVHQSEIVKLLVENGVQIKGIDNTTIHIAVRYNENPEIIKTLVELGADINTKDGIGNTPLHEAIVSNKNPEIIKTLVELGADISTEDGFGDTPLHKAAASIEGPEVIKTLVELGADINAKGKIGDTPLHKASASNKNPEVIKTLVELGADINAKKVFEYTPLHEAARLNENPEVIKTLVELGADVNAKGKFGDTPLHKAGASNENPEVIKILVELGADINVKDKIGNTPLQAASASNKNLEVIKTLVELGAKY